MSIHQIYPKKKKEIFPFWRSLSLTKKLIGINVTAFIVFRLLIILNVLPMQFIQISRIGIESGYFWTFITSMFMHGNFLHLFVNMISLYFVGSLVEKIIGRKRYIWLYLLSGLFAGILHIVFNVSAAVGASGALFGLIGVLIFLTPDLPVYMMFIPIPIKMKYAAPGMLVLLWLITLGTGAPIGNVAHLGGLIAGLAYGLLLRKKFPNKIRMVQQHFR
ncbi:MAG: rhomboid family intramembrane serine protease [Nanoarchaeota archaeon]|jgi:membrane associated rhomboid family serine protease|nr:rhomboid family intramembrane serine protease [Nanoarchaeota archaeon]